MVTTTPTPEAETLVLDAITMAEREVRKGVKRPMAGGLCAAVRQAIDQMNAGNVTTTVQTVRDLASTKGRNQNNAQIEMYGWKRFMGLSQPRARNEKPKGAAEAASPTTRVDGSSCLA